MTNERLELSSKGSGDSGEMKVSPDTPLGKAIIEELEKQQFEVPRNAQPVVILRQEMRSHSHHEGPIPAPEQLLGYKQIDQSFPERIFRMTEDQLAHSRQMDRDALAANREERERYYDAFRYREGINSANEKLGITFAGFICLFGLAAFLVATFLDRGDIAWIPLSIAGLITTGGVGRLLWPKRKNSPKLPGPPED